jgi:hypothetical protein
MQEMMLLLSIVPDPVLIGYAEQETTLFAESFKGDDHATKVADILLSQMIHAEMIWRGLDADALDFFSRINPAGPRRHDVH